MDEKANRAGNKYPYEGQEGVRAQNEGTTAKDPYPNLEDVMNQGNVERSRPEPVPDEPDPWVHRSTAMKCRTCMWFLEKKRTVHAPNTVYPIFGRCRKRAPTMGGYPAVYNYDWCGDHKLDENKI